MPDQLFIRCTATMPNEVEWLLMSDGHLSQGPQRSPLADVPRLLGKGQTIVLVPSEQLCLYRAKVPPASAARLLKAIPYALEDQLAEDIATLHFALGPITKGADIPVAVVKKSLMDDWIQHFQKAQLYVDALVPDVLGLPWQVGQWTVLLTETLAYVRTGPCDGFAVDRDVLPTMLEVCLEEANDSKPDVIKIYCSQNEPLLAELNQLQHISIEPQPLAIAAFIFLAQHLNATPPLNLLQEEYRADRELTVIKKYWFIAGGIAALWLLLNLSFTLTEFFYWHHKNSTLTHQVSSIYYQNFPHATSIEDPKLRMQREIDRLENNIAGGDFLSLLGMVGTTLRTIPTQQLQMTGMAFVDGALSLQLQANNFATLQTLAQKLQAQGLIVSQDSAVSNRQGVQARVTVKRE